MEVMIVLAVLTITAGIAIPNMIGWRGDVSLRGAVSNLKGDLKLARSMAARENANVVILFEKDEYRIFVDNGTSPGNWNREGDERMVKSRQLPPGISIDLAATDLDTDRTRFNSRGLPDPNNLGTIVIVDDAGDQGQIQMNRLGRLTVQ